MDEVMNFPKTVEEFMEQNKVVDTDHVYSNGIEFVPMFRMKQWFEHTTEKTGKWLDTTKEIGWPRWTCSACGGDGRGDYMFCPWCGARMVE